MDFSFLGKYYQFLITGTFNTITLSLLTVIFGLIGGTLLCLMKLSNVKILEKISGGYIAFIRGTPLLVQLYLVYFSVKDMPMYMAGVLAMTINSSAYIAEIIRAGIASIDKGQFEASKALGLTQTMTYKEIILPQAFKNILPALGNEFIVLIKESAIVSVIGLHDLMYKVDTIRGLTYRPFEPLIIAAGIYFILTFTLSKGVSKLERRLQISD
ncbi:amino acid ABC transporter permease [Acidaminobacter sp. JC074]|uniref:amino acid ABC transporter permease n=1 Tax=Acidaminobacter sp. JC074 TaxID=2530199 RepID=UPI001F0EBE62|nr:amino acid ABC transporter permease [Acidaminobacter sp. JC074]MCH4890835.1 amino acid ABC transporter permease [Acidaminobacter sp. JC074]